MEGLEDFARKGNIREGVDLEVYAFNNLVSSLLWPIWVGAHAKSLKARKKMQQRFVDETIRHALFGALVPERHKDLRRKFSASGDE